jgi:hypothetical protein
MPTLLQGASAEEAAARHLPPESDSQHVLRAG